MIKCNKCNIEQNEANFYANRGKTCKHCIQSEYRTLPKLIRVMYNSQVNNCKVRGQDMGITRAAFESWILNQANLYDLYADWVMSWFDKDLRPSVDRLDDYETYTIDNIRLVTWEENRMSAYADRKSGANGKVNHKIAVNGVVYASKAAAKEVTGITSYTINKILAGEKVSKKNQFITVERLY